MVAELTQFQANDHCLLTLQPGDEVEFVVVQNQRSRKMSACSLRKIWLVRSWDLLLISHTQINPTNFSLFLCVYLTELLFREFFPVNLFKTRQQKFCGCCFECTKPLLKKMYSRASLFRQDGWMLAKLIAWFYRRVEKPFIVFFLSFCIGNHSLN